MKIGYLLISFRFMQKREKTRAIQQGLTPTLRHCLMKPIICCQKVKSRFCRGCFSKQERHRSLFPAAAVSASVSSSLSSTVFTQCIKLSFSEMICPIVMELHISIHHGIVSTTPVSFLVKIFFDLHNTLCWT